MTDYMGPLSGVVVALDVDGVLLDSASDTRGHWKTQFARRFGVDADQLRDVFFLRWWPDIIVGRQRVEAGLADAFSALGWDIDVEDALACWFDGDFFINSEVVQAANEWSSRGARIVLATNQERRRASYLEHRLAPLVPFSGMAYSGQLGFLKDEMSFYLEAERLLDIPSPGAVVLVDDTADNVETAHRHGWLGLHFEKGSHWRSTVEELLYRASGC
ncbi:MAG TPA: HAD family hydrolase [Acidimicrobiales bacterium]